MHPHGLSPDVVALIAEICGGSVLIGSGQEPNSVAFRVRPVPPQDELLRMAQRIEDAVSDVSVTVNNEKAIIEVSATSNSERG